MDRGVSSCREASSSASISFWPLPELDEPEPDAREEPGSSGPYAPALIGGSGRKGLRGRGELASVLGDVRRDSMDSGARRPPRRSRGMGAVWRSDAGDARPVSECHRRDELWCAEPEPDGSTTSTSSSARCGGCGG